MVNGLNQYNNYNYQQKKQLDFNGQPQQFNGQVQDKAKEMAQSQVDKTIVDNISQVSPANPKDLPYFAAAMASIFGITKITNKLFDNDWEKTPIKRLTSAIDNIPFVKWADKQLDRLKATTSKTKKPQFVKEIKEALDVNIRPDVAMADMIGIKGEGIDDLFDILERKVLKTSEHPERARKILKELGFDNKGIEVMLNRPNDFGLIKGFTVGTIKQDKALYKEIAENTLSKITYDDFRKVLLNNPLTEAVEKKPEDLISSIVYNIKKPIKEIIANVDNSLVKKGVIPDKTTRLTQRFISGLRKAEIAHNKGAASRLGKKVQKLILQSAEGTTNAMVGPLAFAMVMSMELANVIKRTVNAPKGERLSTFMEEFTSNLAGYTIFTPLMISSMYKPGGLKFLGAKGGAEEGLKAAKKLADETREALINNKLGENYKADRLKVLQKQLDEGKITKEIFDKSKELLENMNPKKLKKLGFGKAKSEMKAILNNGEVVEKALKNGKVKYAVKNMKVKLWQKPLKFLSGIWTTGLKTAASMPGASKLSRKIKGFGGGIGRLLTYMIVLMPFITKFLLKGSHAIFGRPTNSELDDYEKKDEEKKAKKVQQAQPTTMATNNQPNNAQPNNVFIKNYLNNVQASNAPAASSISQSAQPDDVNAALGLSRKKKERYIPSTEAVQLKTEDKSNIDKTLANSDNYIKYIEENVLN